MSRHRAPRRAPRRAAPLTPRTWTRHRFALALALVAALGVGAGGAGTYAFWNDRADITTGSVTAGSIDLQVQVTANGQTTWQAVGRDTGATRTDIAFTGRTPGEYEAYPLTLRNVGNPPGTYTLSVLRGGSWTYLNDAVLVQAFSGTVQEDPTYPVQDTCVGGQPLGSEQLMTGAGPFTLTTSARALAAGGSDTICLRIGIATGAANENQSKSGTLVLRATLTQAQ